MHLTTLTSSARCQKNPLYSYIIAEPSFQVINYTNTHMPIRPVIEDGDPNCKHKSQVSIRQEFVFFIVRLQSTPGPLRFVTHFS